MTPLPRPSPAFDPSRLAWPEILGWGALAAVLLALMLRLPLGLDLSDEAYYAAFIDDWLKGSIQSSTLSTLHQTAALIVYPAARLYHAVMGTSDGLYLWLRALFLIGAVLASLAWLTLLRRLGERHLAFLAAAVILAFIPFSLPAPSYNTLGQQGLVIGLAGHGCSLIAADRRSQLAWAVISAIACAVALVAYPSLALAIAALAGLTLLYHREHWLSLALIALASAMLVAVTVACLTPGRLWASAVYLTQVNDPGGLARKAQFSLALLQAHPLFAALVALSTLLGLLRQRLPAWLVTTSIGLIAVASGLHEPALFARSHDVVTLVALSGLGLLGGLKPHAGSRDRLVAVLYATSLAAGIVTTLTATNAIYNSCIGLLPAATLALLERAAPHSAWRWRQPAAALACLAAILSTTLGTHYGELAGPARQRIESGFFAGIRARPDDLALLDLIRSRVNPLLAAEPTLAVIGRLPGLVLETPARAKMLTVFPLQPNVPLAGLQATARFYADAAHRPAIVLIYTDPLFPPLNPIGPDFATWYRPVETLPTPLGSLAIFARR